MRVNRILALIVLGGLAAAAAPAAVSLPPQVACFGEAITQPLGTAGDDTIYGTAGNDVIHGSGGNDTIYGLGGRDRICGGEGSDAIYGGPGGDLLDGEWGDDRVFGQGGNDGYVLGGDGNDVLAPGPGDMDYTATVEGGAGRDRIVIDRPGYNEVFGGSGKDTIDFRGATLPMIVDLKWGEYIDDSGTPTIGGRVWEVEHVYGSPLGDVIHGNGFVNRLFGLEGDDSIFGRGGDDYLDGGPGTDALDGGGGTDTCLGDSTVACEIWL